MLATWRDFREFVAAKKRKREPIRIDVKPVASAKYKPSSAQGFANFRAALRGVGDWGKASERLDRLERELAGRHGVRLPTPQNVFQNSDRSLSVFWTGFMVLCHPDGFVYRVGGPDGVQTTKITSELLDLLAFQARIQK